MSSLYHIHRPIRGKLKAIRDHVQRLYSHDHEVNMVEETNKLLRRFHLKVETFGELVSFLSTKNGMSSKELSKAARYARRTSLYYGKTKCDAHDYFYLGELEYAHTHGVPPFLIIRSKMIQGYEESDVNRYTTLGGHNMLRKIVAMLDSKGLTLSQLEKLPNKAT